MFRCPECQSVSLVFNFNFEQPYAIRHDKKATEKKKKKITIYIRYTTNCISARRTLLAAKNRFNTGDIC